jgi:hypothetical protein
MMSDKVKGKILANLVRGEGYRLLLLNPARE